MKIFRTNDKRVAKFVHSDLSETGIKTVNSVEYSIQEGEEPVINSVDRNKYSVFPSTSSGCPLKCGFCYLTIDEMPFGKIKPGQVIRNVKEALLVEQTNDVAGLSDRYMKLCWMGMGEAILNPQLVHNGSLHLLRWALAKNLAKGLDGVDLSTTMPKINDEWIYEFIHLNDELKAFPLNPNNKLTVNQQMGNFANYKKRSKFRLFYSLHSAIQGTRDVLIPNTMPITEAVYRLKIMKELGINVIIHHMFLDGYNDTIEELLALIGFMNDNFPNNELRILRYNGHDSSPIKESPVFEACVCCVQSHIKNVKVQVSYGEDIKSACGQFMYNSTPIEKELKPL